jgi:hypothetical protein
VNSAILPREARTVTGETEMSISELPELSILAEMPPEAFKEYTERIRNNEIFVLRNAFSVTEVSDWVAYLTQVGRNSLANYQAIQRGAPNFHRISEWDPRSHVGACFHQFSFFPWNSDVFGLFQRTRKVFELKNLLSGNDSEQFLRAPESDRIVPRISFQFYPRGGGGLRMHSDPVSAYQLTVPTLTMSQKGEDFTHGGAYVVRDGEKICTDDFTRPGDIVFFNASLSHGVDEIDPDVERRWLDFNGRWILLFALNDVGPENSRLNAVQIQAET